jgi:AcrR family transcriptional regulator
VKAVQNRLYHAALRLFAERGVTQVTVSDLAGAAGVARGTVYSNFGTLESLFEDAATRLTTEMGMRIATMSNQTTDPAQRLANGIRFFVRRAHEDPLWGRFLVRFGATTPTLRGLLQGAPTSDLTLGIELGRFHLRADQITSAVAVMSGSVLTAMSLVLEGHQTWRVAAADTAELVLRALGVPTDVAQRLATSELPPLPAADRPIKHDNHGVLT